MSIAQPHSWDLTPKEAIALQRTLACQVDGRTPLGKVQYVAGADISYNRSSPVIYAAVVVLRADDCALVEVQSVIGEARFPYVPGLLSFREAPTVLQAFEQLVTRPDVLMVDGQGYAHPRRFGLACHLGYLLDLPCLGCAKSRLLGTFREPGKRAGSVSALRDKDEDIGKVVRTKDNVQPVYVSVGHKIDLASAIRVVLETCRGVRVPEPTRQAHLQVNALRRRHAEG